MAQLQWDETVDVLVVGSGNGGFTAALCNQLMGAGRVLLVEKGDKVGGTSATSGGGIWIPCSHYAQEAGAKDSLEEAQQYLDQTLEGEGIPPDLVSSYLENGPKMLRYMHDHTDVRYQSLEAYPDYYTTLPGAKTGHRSLEPAPVMASELGEDYKNLTYTHHMIRLFGVIHFTQVEAHMLTLKLPGTNKLLGRLVWDYVKDIPWRLKTKMSRRLACGSAGIARLYLSAKKAGIPIWLNSPLQELISEDGKVIGAVIQRNGQPFRIRTEKGVILAAGGFEQN